MKESYEMELNNLIKEYKQKHNELDKKEALNVNKVCIKSSEYDKLNKWFLEEKLKLMKKFDISTQ